MQAACPLTPFLQKNKGRTEKMKEFFGTLPSGEKTSLYTICCGQLTAKVTDFGATLVSLLLPDRNGSLADVVTGYGDCGGYARGGAVFGGTVGRNANRIAGAAFRLGETGVTLSANENGNNLHSGPDHFHTRLWRTDAVSETSVTFRLDSLHGDQGFPGSAVIRVTYTLTGDALRIEYSGVSDRDTIFNMTNHTYFNLAGHDRADLAMEQTLCMPARFFCPADGEGIPTGECRPVAGTPMDFRTPKPLGQEIGADYEPLRLQGGYDHNFEVFCAPCAYLEDPASGRGMAISTDCPGLQVYTANFTNEAGKGTAYPPRCAVALNLSFSPTRCTNPSGRSRR